MADLKWERLKLPLGTPNHPPVAFHCSELRSPSLVILFGGQRRGLSNALWQFSQGEEGWAEHPVSGAWPSARTQATLTGIGPLSGARVLYLFGGSALNVGPVNDVWALIIGADAGSAEPSWVKLECAGARPSPRYGHSALAWGEKIVIFGGQDESAQFSDVWIFDPAAVTWAQLQTSGVAAPERTRHTATLVLGGTIEKVAPERQKVASACLAQLGRPQDSASGKMLVLGGFSRATRYLADAHVLDLASGAWSPLKLSGAPFGTRSQAL